MTLYREIDALGGTHNSDFLRGYVSAVDDVLAILTKRGFTEDADATPLMYGDMCALLGDMARNPDMSIDHYDEAKRIHDAVTPVDPDLLLARRTVADVMTARDGSLGAKWIDAMLAGQMDTGNLVGTAIAAIKAVRALAESGK